ncbi:hypothetical protein OH76DRAFT_1479176 [Lentinus brumalis]|uniref:DUF6533 domain-containing protein n=1 Tax=Lentinus brumalis TaxID=2498619 RepID=A0A371DNM6_9APHY|nr:hypothetical protein OH76DRAFT_1479176 [Polyporus brumalis]
MSSDASDVAATVTLYTTFYTGYYCNVAAAVLFIYDTFLTFDQEVGYFWTAEHISGASLLFFANKWITMTYHVMILVELASFPSDKRSVCSIFVIVVQAMLILQFVPGAAFSALRAYVLSRSKPLGILVAALSLVSVGVNLVPYGYQFSGEKFPPKFGCVVTNNTTAAINLRSGSLYPIAYNGTDFLQGDHTVVIISRASLIAADILLIYITWTKLSGWAALTDIQRSKRLTLSDVLFHGGVIYFVILFVLNVLHLVLSATSMASDNGDGSFITVFTAPFTAILISRFLLKLQAMNHMVVKLDADDPLHSSRNPWDSTPSFISPLGGFIIPELAARSDDNDDAIDLEDRPPSEAP